MTLGVKTKPEMPLINERIRFEKVQLITHDGQNKGIVTRDEALAAARIAGLDLVVITEQGSLGAPVVKVADFGKLAYLKKKQQIEAKKNQKIIQVKELKLRPKISDHDLSIKIQQMVDFLKDGKHVKLTLSFKGREAILREERGGQLLEKIAAMLEAANLGKNLAQEKDVKLPQMWSRVYYIK